MVLVAGEGTVVTTTEKLLERLDVLLEMGERVLQSSRPPPSGVMGEYRVDAALFHEWSAGGLSFLSSVFGGDHPHARRFSDQVQIPRQPPAVQGQAVLRAAKTDLEGGYLVSVESLVAADIFTDFLEMAEHLLEQGFHEPAASLTGAVLEDGLRKLCERNDVQVRPKSDDLNALTQKLVDKKVFNRLVQKQVSVWAEVRNNADHGHFDEFTREDVRGMLDGVRNLLGDRL